MSSGNAPSMSSGNAPSMSSSNAPSMSSGNAPSMSSGDAPNMSLGNAPIMCLGNAPSCYTVMSSHIYPIIVPSSLNTKDALSSTNVLDYTSVSLDYFPATPGNNFPDFLENPRKNIIPPASLSFMPFLDNPYLKIYTRTSPIPPPAPTTLSIIFPPSPVSLPLFNT
nr:hypothetical protein [Tanacetum cinerariifolium]